jgi:hypothetical protein
MSKTLWRIAILLSLLTVSAFADPADRKIDACVIESTQLDKNTPTFVQAFICAFKASIQTQVIGFLGLIVLIGMGWRYKQTGDTMVLLFGVAGLALILGAPIIGPLIGDWASGFDKAEISGLGTTP